MKIKDGKRNILQQDIKKPKTKSKYNHNVTDEQVEKYTRGEGINTKGIRTRFFKDKYEKKEELAQFSIKQSARAEILLKEETGYLVPDSDEETTDFTQDDIVKNVDITSASKNFKLNLEQFGPYRIDYTKNGKHLLLGGQKGHIAAFDWLSKKLYCEMNVMEQVFDVQWLHVETMFAVAQKQWLHIYDNKGTEIHCVKQMHNVNKLEFLPYHFLLVGGTNEGYLKWLDISIGEMVSQLRTNCEKITMMRQNPSNGVICLGNSKGVVSMWSPSQKEPLAQILCHSSPLTALAVHNKGNRIVTSGLDKKIKIWDTRKMDEPIINYSIRTTTSHIELSHKSVMAVALGNVVELYKNYSTQNLETMNTYLRHRDDGIITDMHFIPYEDVLGIGSRKGFSSILVPGSGEANFDALEANPFMTKKQRREFEVHRLLEKIPSELISLDTNQILGVDVEVFEKKINNKSKIPMPVPINFDLKSKRTTTGIQKSKNKKGQKEHLNQMLLKEVKDQEREKIQKQKQEKKAPEPKIEQSVLERFVKVKSKKKK